MKRSSDDDRLGTLETFRLSITSYLPQTHAQRSMGKKVAKSARKFAASGQLKKTIDARRKNQQIKKKFDRKQQSKGKGAKSKEGGDEKGDGRESAGKK